MDDYLKIAKVKYPNAWKQADGFRSEADLPKWEKWCFLPLAGWIAIVSGGYTPTLGSMTDVSKLAALGAWRMTKGIFMFDEVLASELTKTPFAGDLPADVLTRLPHWCCYIPYKFVYLGKDAVGFFAYLEHDMNNGNVELRFLIDFGSFDTLSTAILHLGDWTITEAINKFSLIAKKNSDDRLDVDMDMVETVSADINSLVSLVLYLCSQEPDYGHIKPVMPQMKKTKKGMRVFATPAPTVFNIGTNISKQIRKINNEKRDSSLPHTKRPHIRKAHWHGFWTGSKKNVNKPRKYIHKWLPPTMIAFD